MPARTSLSFRQWLGVALAALFLPLACPAHAAQGSPETPSGTDQRHLDVTVVYRERMALPPDAVLLVSLYERASSGKRALVSELRLPTEGRNVPLPFRISWPEGTPAPGKDAGRYELEARILGPDGPLFATPEPVAVPPAADGPPLVLMTHRVMSRDNGVSASPAATVPAARPVPVPPATPGAQGENGRAPSSSLAPLPALYTGEGGTPSLYLAADHSYILTRKKEGAAPDVESGRWHVIERGAILQLAGAAQERAGKAPRKTTAKARLTRIALAAGANPALAFPAGGPALKRTSPIEGTEQAASAEPGEPAKSGESGSPVPAAPPADSRPFVGQFRSTAEGATLRECASGVTYAVNKGKAFRLVREIYLSKSRDPGAELLVDVDARILTRPEQIGSGGIIAIDEFRRMEKEACPGEDRAAPHQLAGRRWRLLEVYGHPAEVYDNQPEPHLTFAPTATNKGRIAGSDGCNNIVGQYLRDGSTLRFLGLGATMKLCPEGAEQSSAFARALAETEAWRLSGDALELFGKGRLLAAFEAVAL